MLNNSSPGPAAIARMIDHALLHPTLSDAGIVEGCGLARRLGLFSVCVKPCAVPLATAELRGSTTAVGTVIGFPHGGTSPEIKRQEAAWSLAAGAVELDMVVNIGKVFSEDWDFVSRDIAGVVKEGHAAGAIVKVIFETDLVTRDDWKRRLCAICTDAGADFVKTSTGFGFVRQAGGGYDYHGATESDVRLMREASGAEVGVKASGGVRDYQQACRFIELGATRLGTSASETILAGAGRDERSY